MDKPDPLTPPPSSTFLREPNFHVKTANGRAKSCCFCFPPPFLPWLNLCCWKLCSVADYCFESHKTKEATVKQSSCPKKRIYSTWRQWLRATGESVCATHQVTWRRSWCLWKKCPLPLSSGPRCRSSASQLPHGHSASSPAAGLGDRRGNARSVILCQNRSTKATKRITSFSIKLE